MNTEFEGTAEKKKITTAGQASVIPAGSNSKSASARSKQNSDGPQLPALVEFTYTISAIMVIFASLIVAVISLINGASLIDLVIRTAVTILVTGAIFMLISWQISSDALKASLAELADEKEKAEKEAKEKDEQEALERREREKAEKMQDVMADSIFEDEQ
jgi:low affinity Fe/Cu permease